MNKTPSVSSCLALLEFKETIRSTVEMYDVLLPTETSFDENLLGTTFISAFARFEKSFQDVCEQFISNDLNIYRSDIIVCKRVLETYFNLIFDFGHWDELVMYQQVQMKLVMKYKGSSTTDPFLNSAVQKILSLNGLCFSDRGLIRITSRCFPERFFFTATRYLQSTVDLLQKNRNIHQYH